MIRVCVSGSERLSGLVVSRGVVLVAVQSLHRMAPSIAPWTYVDCLFPTPLLTRETFPAPVVHSRVDLSDFILQILQWAARVFQAKRCSPTMESLDSLPTSAASFISPTCILRCHARVCSHSWIHVSREESHLPVGSHFREPTSPWPRASAIQSQMRVTGAS